MNYIYLRVSLRVQLLGSQILDADLSVAQKSVVQS